VKKYGMKVTQRVGHMVPVPRHAMGDDALIEGVRQRYLPLEQGTTILVENPRTMAMERWVLLSSAGPATDSHIPVTDPLDPFDWRYWTGNLIYLRREQEWVTAFAGRVL
jgi:hypothetical protein